MTPSIAEQFAAIIEGLCREIGEQLEGGRHRRRVEAALVRLVQKSLMRMVTHFAAIVACLTLGSPDRSPVRTPQSTTPSPIRRPIRRLTWGQRLRAWFTPRLNHADAPHRVSTHQESALPETAQPSAALPPADAPSHPAAPPVWAEPPHCHPAARPAQKPDGEASPVAVQTASRAAAPAGAQRPRAAFPRRTLSIVPGPPTLGPRHARRRCSQNKRCAHPPSTHGLFVII